MTQTTADRVGRDAGGIVLPLIALAVILAATFAVAFLTAIPEGADHVVERSLLEDPTGLLGIDDVVDAEFRPMEPVLAASYTRSAHWIRLRIRASAEGRPLVLRLRPSFIDTITLFEPDTQGADWRARTTGDLTPFAEREVAAVALALQVEPDAPDTVYYLRMDTTSSSLFGVQALDWRDMRRAELSSDAVLVGFLAIACCILFWSFGELVARVEAITVIFILSQISYMLYVLAVMGYLAPLLPDAAPGAVHGLTNILVCLTPAVGVMLHRQIFLLYAPARIVSGVSWAMCACAVALTGVLLVGGHTQFALRSISTLLFLSSAFYFAMAFWPWKERAPSPLMRALYAAQAFAFVISIAPLLGIGSLGEWTFHYPYILVLTYGAMMFFLVHSRGREMAIEEGESRARLDLMSQALGAERRQRDIQDRFTAMLLHEIRSPLSAIRLSLDPVRLGAERYRDVREALAEIDGTIERCSLAEHADGFVATQRGDRFDLAEALREVVARHAPDNPVAIDAAETMLVHSDRRMADVVLSNLVDNALKYAPTGTTIRFACRPADGDGAPGALVSVENATAEAPDPARVFDKFYRAPGSLSKSGSGLGLYVVAGVTELLGGRIDCIVGDDLIRFEFWLPLAPSPERGAPEFAATEHAG